MNGINWVNIGKNSKIKIEWSDKPENYSKEAKTKIKNHFAKKYGVKKDNIDVIYRPVKFTETGDVIEVNGASIENIMDVNYQRELMREWIKRENKNVDFNRIIKLDEKINAELNIENNEIQHNSWAIKWLMIDNFLSFGGENYLAFSKLRGLTVVNSEPKNQGGKTTLTIDSIKFLLHGNTTKTDKNEEIFNQFSASNELVVRGMIEIANEEVIIERKMKRSAKKGGGWTITNKLNYYKLLPDGEEEQLNEEDATKTTAKLRATIGSEKDFEMLVLATEKNLDDLIGLTTTESGKVLTRLIGLEVIEMKEAAVRKMYNEFASKKKSNNYDVVTLTNDITEHDENINLSTTIELEMNKKLEDTKIEISNLSAENDRLLNSKISIDVKITALNPSKLEEEIKSTINNGLKLKDKISELEIRIKEIGNVNFDEDEYYRLTNEHNKLVGDIRFKKSDVQRLVNIVQDLIDGGICQSCNRQLDDIDNSEHIKTHNETIDKFRAEINKLEENELRLKSGLLLLSENKGIIDEKNKIELQRDRIEVEMGSLRNEIISKKNDLKKYTLNLEAIELNRNIDSEVSMVKAKSELANRAKDEYISKIEKIRQEIQKNTANIQEKNNLIVQIKKEEDIDRIYKIYIELVGKKGISKLVLRSVLPIINSEVQRLLEDSCDFEIEIFIDDKNDVQFLLNKDGVSRLLKSGSGFEKTASSLALRGILGKLSTLPMPNFITFDEVLGKVSNDNLEKLRPLFEKIKNMYEIVFLITHNDIIRDWGDSIITVIKENNISKLTLN